MPATASSTRTRSPRPVPARKQEPILRSVFEGHDRIDVLLRTLITLVIREHVSSWYSGISKDQEFVRRVFDIFVHVVRQVEARVRQVDLIELVAVDVPFLIERHVKDWHEAVDKAGSGHAHNLSPEATFHQSQPHIAVQLDRDDAGRCSVDKVYLRALVDSLLKLLLPIEDYEAETERLIVREIVVNVVLGAVFERTAQPWMIQQILLRQLQSWEARKAPRSSSQTSWPTTVANAVLGAYRALSTVTSTLINGKSMNTPSNHNDLVEPSLKLAQALLPPSKAVTTAAHYVEVLNRALTGMTNRFARQTIERQVLTSETLEKALESATDALFPNGHPPPKQPDPDADERHRIREDCIVAIASIIPDWLVRALDAQDKSQVASYLLDPFSTHTANVHLFVVALDVVVGKVFPELVSL